MKKISIFSIVLSLFFCQSILSKPITSLFFDVETIFESDDMKASGYIGKWDSVKYIASTGHKPSQEELFKQLKNVDALSKEMTFNSNLDMPLIFSDWLSQKQNNEKLKEIIRKFLSNSSLAAIEIKILLAIVNMMLTPEHLADIQKVRSKIETLLKTLQQKGYKLYLVGNWAHINSLKNKHSQIFKYFQNSIVSGDSHFIKPYKEHYEYILEKTKTNPSNALWIEVEQKFATRAKKYGYNVILVDKNYNSITAGLKQAGISV